MNWEELVELVVTVLVPTVIISISPTIVVDGFIILTIRVFFIVPGVDAEPEPIQYFVHEELAGGG